MPQVAVFLSHISEEAALAKLLRDRLADSFLGMIDIFVSSDPDSLHLGERWVDRITDELRTCAVMLILCSEYSVSRPWINFEAGAGWVRENFPVIPICHTGMDKNNLPLPLKLLQGINANQEAELRSLYSRIARALESTVPAHDFAELAARVVDFEQEYGVTRHVREHVHHLIRILPELAGLFEPAATKKNASGYMLKTQIERLTPHLDWLRTRRLVKYTVEETQMTVEGPGAVIEISMQDAYYEIAATVMDRTKH